MAATPAPGVMNFTILIDPPKFIITIHVYSICLIYAQQ